MVIGSWGGELTADRCTKSRDEPIPSPVVNDAPVMHGLNPRLSGHDERHWVALFETWYK
jgi:hypothetical protein